jgi:hypothetical protein
MHQGGRWLAGPWRLIVLARACVAVLSLLAVLGWQASSSAAPAAAAKTKSGLREPAIRLHMIGTSSSRLHTDGVRWAVYEPTEGVTRIMNTVKGYAVNRPDPPGCTGGLLAIGGGEILYACSDPECPEGLDACLLKTPETFCPPAVAGTSCRVVMVSNGYETGRWIVEDIASGMQHQVAIGRGLPARAEEYAPEREVLSALEAIGSQWAAGEASGGGRFFVDWHTGHVIFEEGKQGEAEASEEPESANLNYENLDSEALLAPLCPPLKRGLAPSGIKQSNGRYFRSSYGPPFMVEERFKLSEVHHHAFLRRCGSTREELISELSGGWEELIGDGVLSGSHRLWRLNAHKRPWLGRSYRLVVPPQSREAREVSVGHTSTMVFETIEPTPGPDEFREGAPTGHSPERYEIWVGRLPWR